MRDINTTFALAGMEARHRNNLLCVKRELKP